MQQWKGSLAGKVKTINHTLLERVVPPGTEGSGIVQVNSSVECLLEVLEEAKGLSKLNVVIPDSVKNLLHQVWKKQYCNIRTYTHTYVYLCMYYTYLRM